MSYSVRDDNATFGNLAAVEIGNGAGAPTVTRLQNFEPAGILGGNATNLVTATKYCVFQAPLNPTSTAPVVFPLGGGYQIFGGQFQFNTASSSGTLAIEVCAPGTADGSGVNVLSTATVSLSSGASATPTAFTFNSNVDNLVIPPGGRINMIIGGTLTGLVNFSAVLFIGRTS